MKKIQDNLDAVKKWIKFIKIIGNLDIRYIPRIQKRLMYDGINKKTLNKIPSHNVY